MVTKNFFAFILYAIVFIAAFTIETVAQSPCPNFGDLLFEIYNFRFIRLSFN